MHLHLDMKEELISLLVAHAIICTDPFQAVLVINSERIEDFPLLLLGNYSL